MKKKLTGILFLIPLSILLVHLNDFLFIPGSDFSDLAISHVPNALSIQNSITTYHQIPLWSDAILSVYPFFADPLSGLYYPPGWIAYLFAQPLGFNLTLVLHLLFAGVGMYLFLREIGIHHFAALCGALLFESLPKISGHIGQGHITLIYAVCWTPLLMLFAARIIHQRKKLKYAWLSGIILGVIFLADPRWAPFAGLFWLGFLLTKNPAKEHFFRQFLYIMVGGVTALIVSAPLLIPLSEFVGFSTRLQMTPGDNLTLSSSA